jgi:hypothetical protein
MKKLILLLMACPAFAFAQNNSSIHGVVTFFFNQYQGDKPDIGAGVFILDSTKAKRFNPLIVDSFIFGNSYRHIAANYRQRGSSIPDNILRELRNFGADSDDNFRALDNRCYMSFLTFQSSDDANSTTVDATGSYYIAVKPGVYYIFIRSHNRTSMTVSEYSGRLFFRKVKVKSGQTIDVSTRFDIE